MKPARLFGAVCIAASALSGFTSPATAFELPDGWEKRSTEYVHKTSGYACPLLAGTFAITSIERSPGPIAVFTCNYIANGARGMVRVRVAASYPSTAQDPEYRLGSDPSDLINGRTDFLVVQDLDAPGIDGKPARRTQIAGMRGGFLADCTLDTTRTEWEPGHEIGFLQSCMRQIGENAPFFIFGDRLFVLETNISPPDLQRRTDDDGIITVDHHGDIHHMQSGAVCPALIEYHYLYDVKFLPHPGGRGMDILCDYQWLGPEGHALNFYVTAWPETATMADVRKHIDNYLTARFGGSIDRTSCKPQPQEDGTPIVFGAVVVSENRESVARANLQTLVRGWSVEALYNAPAAGMEALCTSMTRLVRFTSASIDKPSGFNPPERPVNQAN